MIISFRFIVMIEINIFECFTLLSAVAAITERIKIGQLVTCNSYRNPSLLAKMLSTLDIISKGRVELGIGACWYEQEYTAYGYHFPSNVSRITLSLRHRCSSNDI